MIALNLPRSRAEVLTDVRAKHAAAMRAADRANAAENWPTAMWWLERAARLGKWMTELERVA